MQCNFLLTKGTLQPGYRRALKSAAVHGVPVVLWCANRVPPDLTGLDVRLEFLDIPESLGRLAHQAHVFDVMAYKIGYEHGGLVLGLDTISVRPALDLLGNKEVVVSTDWPDGDANCGMRDGVRQPYNNNFIARKGSDMAGMLYERAVELTSSGDDSVWGITGPLLLTEFVSAYPNLIAGAPYPALCGWAPGYVWKSYLGLEPVHPDCRVIHLCRTAYLSLWEKRYDDWNRENPAYAQERTTLNDWIFEIC